MNTNEFIKLLNRYCDAKNDIFAINESYYDIMTYDIDGWFNHVEDNDATTEDYEQLKAQVKSAQDLFSALRRLDYRFS